MSSARRSMWSTLARGVPVPLTMGLLTMGLVPAGLAGGGLAAAAVRPASAGVISVVAGGAGGPGPATSVGLFEAHDVAFAAGHLYVADGPVVRAVTPATGYLTTPVGAFTNDPATGDGGPAAQSHLLDATSVAVTGSGDLLASDDLGSRIRIVRASTGTFFGQPMSAGHIYTVAGDGASGYSGDGGPATRAKIRDAEAIAVDLAGNLVLDDSENNRVRVVAAGTGMFYGRAMTVGDIYTVAGDGTAGFAGDGGPATGAKLNFPDGVAVDGLGNLVIADPGNNRVRVVAAKTGTFYRVAMKAGDIYTVAGDGTAGFAGDGGPAASAELNVPEGMAVDGSGNLVIADPGNHRIRVVAASTGTFYGQPMAAGDIYTVAGDGRFGGSGDGGPATSAEFEDPQGVTLDGAGNLAIADPGSNRVRVVAGSTGRFYGRPMTAGDVYPVAGNGELGYSGDGGPPAKAELSVPETGQASSTDLSGVATDSAGDTVISDLADGRIRLVAGRTGTRFGRPVTAGHIYTIAGNGRLGFSGDGGPATKAEFDTPEGVAVYHAGNVLIADSYNERIRVVAVSTGTFYGQSMTAGNIYTVAGDGSNGFAGDGGPATSAELDAPWGVAVDGPGNLVIGDTGNNRVRVVAVATGTFYGQPMTAGDIYAVAGDGVAGSAGNGGPATSAELDAPQGVAVDGSGNLVISDPDNQRIRVVAASSGTFYGQPMTAGDIYPVAGDGTRGFSGDGGLATKAELSDPPAVAIDAAGNLLIADSFNQRIRVVAASAGTFYGVAMKAGDIYTVAGNGRQGFSGDGGLATKAELGFPVGIASGGSGIVFSDSFNNRVREITG